MSSLTPERFIERGLVQKEMSQTLEAAKIVDGNFYHHHILSVGQFYDRPSQDLLFSWTVWMKANEKNPVLKEICRNVHAIIAFFESSTRTDLSHNSSIQMLGGTVASASNGINFSSFGSKGESFGHTMMALGSYPDLIVSRFTQDGDALEAAAWLNWLRGKTGHAPVLINAGDGAGEHPTQALLDKFTIEEVKGKTGRINILLGGDLKNGRTVHSLAQLFAFDEREVNFIFVSPESLKMPPEITSILKERGVRYYETNRHKDVIGLADIVYWTRVQKERFETVDEYNDVKDKMILTMDDVLRMKEDAELMHPLPSVGDMGRDAKEKFAIDNDHRAWYFHQMRNGLFVRMALIALVAGDQNVLRRIAA